MRVTTVSAVFGDGKTAFQEFMETYDLYLLTVKVQCPRCRHTWGIKVDDYVSTTDIPEKKFACGKCGHYYAGGRAAREMRIQIGNGEIYSPEEAEGLTRAANIYVSESEKEK